MPSAPMKDGADQRSEESDDHLIEYLSGVAVFAIDRFCLQVHDEKPLPPTGSAAGGS
jgi:hypothetical protein